jgi:competence protein ComEA
MRIMNTLLASALVALVSTSAFAQLQQTPPAAAPAPAAPVAKPAMPAPAAPAATAPAPAKPAATAPAAAAKPAVAAPAAATAPKLVNLNSATADQLDTIPNIGEKRSEAIIKGRPYVATQDLVTKKVLTQGIFDKIKDKVTVKVNLNTASAEDLDTLPGIGDKRSAAIMAGRPYKSANELVAKKVLTQGVFDKIKGNVDVK